MSGPGGNPARTGAFSRLLCLRAWALPRRCYTDAMRTFELTILGLAALMSQGAARGASPRLKTIYSFTYIYGDDPTELIEKDGVLYGAINEPGAAVFQLMPAASPGGAWTETVPGANGRFYGTRLQGGT